MESYLEIHPEIKNALAAGRPVVALESTIISHGMPYPQNIDSGYISTGQGCWQYHPSKHNGCHIA